MYNLAISLTLTENRRLAGEKLMPLIRDTITSEVSVSPVIIVDAETMSAIRSKLHDLVDDFIDDMVDSGEFSEFDEDDDLQEMEVF